MGIPSELGYGDQGSPPKIGGGDVLVFKMEILDIQGGSVPALTCTVEGGTDNCNEKELKYVEKIKGWDYATKVKSEKERLNNMLATGTISEANADWIRRR